MRISQLSCKSLTEIRENWLRRNVNRSLLDNSGRNRIKFVFLKVNAKTTEMLLKAEI